MPGVKSSRRGHAPPQHHGRRAASVASNNSNGSGGGADGRTPGAGRRETSLLLHGGSFSGVGFRSGIVGGGSVGGNGASAGSGMLQQDDDDTQYFELQLFAYRLIYVFQGVFLGLLGPSLDYFSSVALATSDISSPVASYGPIFAAHGGAALVMSFMSEIVLTVAIEMDTMKHLMVVLLLCSGTWYACLPSVAASTGSLGVSVYFIAKGFWTALLNISLNRCCLWVAGDHIENGRSLVTSMNFAYGFGTMLGPILAAILGAASLQLDNAFYALGLAQLLPLAIIVMLPSPRSLHGRDMNESLLGFEDPTRRVPTVPSPIVGGVFLHVKHYGGSANCNPDTYDPLNNLIILLVTLFVTILFGIQLGLAAFLFDYVGHVLTDGMPTISSSGVYQWGCLLLALFWACLWLSYLFFSKYMFHALNLYSIFHLSLICLVSSFGILFGAETGFTCFVLMLALFGFALAPLFTLSIHCLTRVINELLIRRVSSLIVFGCGMGEGFIPVLMGFFMGNFSGKQYGSVAVSYILFILSMCLVGVSGMLLFMVRKKLQEVTDEPLDSISVGGRHSLHQYGGTSGSTHRAGSDNGKRVSYQRGV